jgi:hypothetical protein
MNGEERKYSYKWLFCEIIDVVFQNVSVRFSETANSSFWAFSMPDIFPCTESHFLKTHFYV